MNAQVKLTIDECFEALDYERKQSAKLEKRLASVLSQNKKYAVEISTLRQNVFILNSKIEKNNIPVTPGISCDDEKNMIIDELRLNVKKRKDAIELLDVLLQLRDVDKFWRVVKTQNLNAITTILTGMKTQEGFDLVLSKIKDK
jgi:hypothetical protein